MVYWPNPVEAEAHITSELSRSGLDWKPSGRNNIKICCPNPHAKGMDTSFNLELTRDGRKAHCWVCNWSGSWNKLAKIIGASGFGVVEDKTSPSRDTYSDNVIDVDLFDLLYRELDEDFKSKTVTEEATLPSGLTEWDRGRWRGLPSDFLLSVPSFMWNQRVDLRDEKTNRVYKTFYVERILWPYMQFGRLAGYCGRRLDKSSFQKYFRFGHAKDVLFPFDFMLSRHKGTRSVVLVEGEVDALNLLNGGVPTLAILGTNNWSDRKRDLLHAVGIRKVFLLMDPDFAGDKAATEILEKIHEDFDTKKLALSDPEQDPGSLQPDQIKWLKRKISTEVA